MRRMMTTAAAILLVAACGSSSTEYDVMMQGSMDGVDVTAASTGDAVANGVVCSSTTHEFVGWEGADGASITEEEFGALVDEAAEKGEVPAAAVLLEFTCDDGSGTFTMRQQLTMSPADYDFTGLTMDTGSWTIERGTGDYQELYGTGAVHLDFGQGEWMCEGDLVN